ncbi:hypothetical protein AB19_0171 [Escherichia coli 3-373-03_S1_C1]|nr:hypothetical protein AB47_3361 [Escherichia coli 3-373-03_S1_C2]KDU40730.1 hypothetical protein AB77_2012 [Escherichia coli 3-373-03_S1_C3]KDU48809.1 hypothetical protein AB19_0171 [Escherichia coli 3-373-03_S1_C1]KEL44148.1 hypothetical protein AC51_2427 [Escherichia coli 5-172-05_S3_C3]STJ72496.1 Uncharacterised protein [Escherichia coli]
MIYAELTPDEKSIVALFSCEQENTTQIHKNDVRYIEFYNLQPKFIQKLLPTPAV